MVEESLSIISLRSMQLDASMPTNFSSDVSRPFASKMGTFQTCFQISVSGCLSSWQVHVAMVAELEVPHPRLNQTTPAALSASRNHLACK